MATRKKQTKDAFPKTVLYSRDRIWAKPSGDRLARIGFALPALSEQPPNVYFVDVQRLGYIVEGKVFGALEIDTGRVELIAPFTCRIDKVNTELLDDPLYLMAEPFGSGWLYEVSKVRTDAFPRLMDRDQFWTFIELERLAKRLGVPAVIGASVQQERDAAWPERLRVTFGGRTILTGRLVRTGRNRTFTPQWSKGDAWVLETSFEQPSIAMLPADFTAPAKVTCRWRFEVMSTSEQVDGDECSEVHVREIDGPPPQSYLKLFYGVDDFSLRRIEEISLFDPTMRTVTPNDWGRESYMELRRPRDLILDLPLFPTENRDETRKVEVPGEPRLVQRARFPDAYTMELVVEGEGRGGGTVTSRQVWERGLPFWREASRSVGGKVVIEGRFVRLEAATPAAAGSESVAPSAEDPDDETDVDDATSDG